MLARLDDDALDAGAKSSGSERLCALTREVKPVGDMIRFVLSPDGKPVPDLKRNLPGRGLWITATRNAVQDAAQRKIFARGFKRDVSAGPDLATETERLLERSVLDALAIAGKAGQVVTGFSKVEAALGRDHIRALLHATEAAADGKRKLAAVWRQRHDEEGPPLKPIEIIEAFGTEQLDLALGRANVVHAALLAGPASDSFLARYRRLTGFRTGSGGLPGQIRTTQA